MINTQIKKYSKKDIEIWKNTNISSLHIKIENNIAEFTKLNNSMIERSTSIKQMINDAIKKYTIKDLEIIINLEDNPYNNLYFLSISSTTNSNVNTIPGYCFYQWDYPKSENYFKIKEDILKINISWENKIDKIMWSGLNSNIIRNTLNTNHPFYEYNLVEQYTNTTKFYSLPDHCNYKYLLDLEGVGFAGRFPYISLTGSCIIILENSDPNRDYKLYYDKDFIEDIHYLKVRYDTKDSFEDIHNKIMKKIENNDCKKIGYICREKANTIFTFDTVLLSLVNILNYYSEYYEKIDVELNKDLDYNKSMRENTRKILINKYF